MPFRPLMLVLSVFLSIPGAAFAASSERNDVVVSEADFDAWQRFTYEGQLRDARVEQDPTNLAAHQASYQAAVKATGLSARRAELIEEALLGVDDTVLRFEQGQLTKGEFDAAIAGFKPQTVATARRHQAHLRGDRGHERARNQALKEAVDARKGDFVTQADLQGVWVLDAEASIRNMLGVMADLPEMAGARAELERSLDGTSYEFKGNRVVVSMMQGGKKHVSEGTFRIEGRNLVFDQAAGVRDIDVGMKNGRLILGVGVASTTYKKKP